MKSKNRDIRNTANRYAYNEHGLLPSDIEVLGVLLNNADESYICSNLTLQAIADLTPSKFCKTVVHRALKRLNNKKIIKKEQMCKKTNKGTPQYAYKILEKGLNVMKPKDQKES